MLQRSHTGFCTAPVQGAPAVLSLWAYTPIGTFRLQKVNIQALGWRQRDADRSNHSQQDHQNPVHSSGSRQATSAMGVTRPRNHRAAECRARLRPTKLLSTRDEMTHQESPVGLDARQNIHSLPRRRVVMCNIGARFAQPNFSRDLTNENHHVLL